MTLNEYSAKGTIISTLHPTISFRSLLFRRICIVLTAILLIPFLSSAQRDKKEKKEKKDPYTSREIWVPVPINRQLSHDLVDNIQKAADEFDGDRDGMIGSKDDPVDAKMLTQAIIKQVDHLQIVIENLPLDHYKKIQYLKELKNAISGITEDLRNGTLSPQHYKNIVINYEALFKRQQNEEDIVDFINQNFTRSFYTLMPVMFKDSAEAVAAVYKNMVRLYPDEMFKRFREIAPYPAAEDLIAHIAPKQPSLILTYATSTSIERGVVRRSKDPLVMQIVEIADNAKVPLRAIVYLEDLKNGVLTINDVNTVTQSSELYYKSLVQQRMKTNTLTKRLLERESKYQALEYVRIMNELHDAKDPIRFKCLESLTPKEMYFLMVLCSDEIYTSTFVGTFNRMLIKMGPVKGDVFLADMNMDKFRTFIRMCAGYNKLDEFIATIDAENRNILMATFVKNIDKNTETDLEDAVDVADSFGSITDPDLLEYLLGEVTENYERTYKENNKRGLIIYFLLHTLCNSAINPEQSSDALQEQLKVPPITYVPNNILLNDSNAVIEQVFFYGDEDGISSFASFQSIFRSDEWRITKNDKWFTATSTKGKPVSVYANLPLHEPADEEAQKALCAYLDQNNLSPSILVHRGHSYHLSTTMSHLSSNNKIIILGSCGGYHNLSTILEQSEDAHIISSKQTGTMHVNDPMLADLNKLLVNGKDVNWIDFWAALGAQMKSPQLQDLFNDYVPPHKNMGALFLKAFKIQMIENGLVSN